jgi:hypothetical protein
MDRVIPRMRNIRNNPHFRQNMSAQDLRTAEDMFRIAAYSLPASS